MTDELGWRDRAIALAALGGAVLGRAAFARHAANEPSSLQMQALVYLAIRDPTSAHVGEDATDTSLRLALRLDQEVVEELLDLLEEKGLLVRKLPGLEEPLIALTPLGAEQVALWLERTRSIFRGWPPDRPDVDDVVK